MLTGEICILAGGLSTRMGRNEARLRLRGKTLLRHIHETARSTSWPVRIIRRDLVPRCGPLGGIYTALKTSKAGRVLFLACDMPFVSVDLLEWLITSPAPKVFATSDGKAGFPFLLARDALPIVEKQLAIPQYSVQALAEACHAALLQTPSSFLFNINTPGEWQRAQNISQNLPVQ